MHAENHSRKILQSTVHNMNWKFIVRQVEPVILIWKGIGGGLRNLIICNKNIYSRLGQNHTCVCS